MTPRLPKPRPELASLKPYKTSDVEGGRVHLHANENPYPPPDDVVEEIHALARTHDMNRYPAEPTQLIELLADYAGVDPEWVWIGDGSNEVLLQSCLAYGGPRRAALLFEPTYRMHHRQARIAGTDVIETARRDDFTIDLFDALETIDAARPHVVFLCSPNNPTGTLTPLADIKEIAEVSPGLVIVDEAYFEFSGTTFVPELARYPNVLVSRTFSKAFRLASVRLGYAIAHPDLLAEIRRVRMPYGQSAFTLAAATIAVMRRDKLLDAVPTIIAERERVSAALAEVSSITAFDSAANFVMFRHPTPEGLLAGLQMAGVVIRDFSSLKGCEGCLRVTIGTPEQNDAFLRVVTALA